MIIRNTLNSFGLTFALVLAAVAFGNSPTQAQERGTYIRATVDGKFDEYVDSDMPNLMAANQTQAVQDVQIFLNELGYYRGNIDGMYDDDLSMAVANFQSYYSLDMTGEVDEATWMVFRSIDTDAIYEAQDRYDATTGVYYNYRGEDAAIAQRSHDCEDSDVEYEAEDMDMMDTEASQSAPVRGLW